MVQLLFGGLLLLLSGNLSAQLFKVELQEKIEQSGLIVEGKVVDKRSFWNDDHSMIYTANKIEIYKVFKGNYNGKTIEVLTQGGSVGGTFLHVSDLLELDIGKVGIFFCSRNNIDVKSPSTRQLLWDVYSSKQGFLKYDLEENSATAPFVKYRDIRGNLYPLLQSKTGRPFKIISDTFSGVLNAGSVDEGGAGVLGTITSFSPSTVNGGALLDPVNNLLTINGTGFGTKASGKCGINFKDANNDNAAPDYNVPYTSGYFVSWTDTRIVIKVPSRAGTGPFEVVLNDGSKIRSSTDLTVFFSVLNFNFDFSSVGIDTVVITEPRLMNTNDQGGYTIQYSTSTAGGGKDFSTSTAKNTFLRALATWKDAVGANFIVGATTTTQKIADDNVNLIVFDNKNTGVPVMSAGVLEVTYSWGSTCYIESPFSVLTAQKTGFDILVRNNGVSQGNNPITDGPCFPANNEYDLETVLLHELGHCLNLTHINADGEGSFIPELNPPKVMHYAISNYIDRRSLDRSALAGAQYTTRNQSFTFGSCGLYTKQMTPLQTIIPENDDCPVSFPTVATPDGTIVNFDLIHTTSNHQGDPQYKAVNCTGKGTNVTNNAYYAYKTGSLGEINISVRDYTTLPAELSNCPGQGIRMAIYDVATCPNGQAFPDPIACQTFSGNGSLPTITGLQPDHTYLFYFDGVRNTKASFNIAFNGGDAPPTPTGSVLLLPNPVVGDLSIKFSSIAPGKYQVNIYDMTGRQFAATSAEIVGNQTIKIPMGNAASGVYIVKIMAADGTVILKQKVIKHQ